MRAVLQRVGRADVTVDGACIGKIEQGLLVLLGIEQGDNENDLEYIVSKVCGMRIFEDDEGKMNRSVEDIGGSILVVSQFTLMGDARKGRRPSFVKAGSPADAKVLYEKAVEKFRATGIPIETGEYQAEMQVSLVNDGPVTILLDSKKTF
ncbi:MAG: D-tyrosyl-tRNA(Tyr) deacylase [Christensenellaceae bacterium]|nr:D-tyrosyl-tRNA(Tyr) deacylase [Christensenellaceae bacterium]